MHEMNIGLEALIIGLFVWIIILFIKGPRPINSRDDIKRDDENSTDN